MNHRENDTTQENEGKQVQQELEEQLRAFGNTMSDAFAHGFEGRGMDIGDRAFDVGRPMPMAARQSSTPGCPSGPEISLHRARS